MIDPAQDNQMRSGGETLERLLTRGWEFDFFPAVRLLQRFANADADIGDRGPVSAESIRFRPRLSVGFPSTEVGRVATERAADGRTRYRLDVTFMGLYGVSTPLPLHYSIDLLRSVDPYVPVDRADGEADASSPFDPNEPSCGPGDTNAVRDFLDIFHHRLISLLYRSWTKYRYCVLFDDAQRDRLTEYLLHMIGLSPDREDRTIGVDPVRMIRYAGVLTQHPRSAVTLEGVVSDYLGGLETQVESFRSRWVPVMETDQNRIGAANCRLGEDLTVGEWVYDLSGAFNLAIGPLDWDTYKRFLPGRDGHAEVRSLVSLYCQDPLWLTIELRLKAREIPELRLTCDDDAGMLGMTTWVRTAEIGETSVTFDESSTVFETVAAREGRRRQEDAVDYQPAGA